MNEEQQLRDEYNKGAFEYFNTRTNQEAVAFQNKEIERPTMFSLVPQDLQGKKLLDAGCGPGIHAKEYVSRGAQVSGIDLSDELIIIAQKQCPQGAFQTGSVYNLPYDNNYFDIVTSSFVLCHVQHRKKAIQEMTRVLKKGGLLIVSVSHPITFMFRESDGNSFKPSHSYFDRSSMMFKIIGKEETFPGFAETMADYFKPYLEEGLILKDFREHEPNPHWLKKYPQLQERKDLLKIPLLCFFTWEKL